MNLSLLLCCSLVALSTSAMTDEQLVYGLVKMYHAVTYEATWFSPGSWGFFLGSMMGWHINKNRTTSARFKVMEGLANFERFFKFNLDTHFETFNFADPIDMEPYYTVFYNDSLSHLYLDHMWLTFQQLLIIRKEEVRIELERVLLHPKTVEDVNMTDIPSTGLTRYKLMADGYAYLARLTGQTRWIESEIEQLKCKAELIDANIPNHISEFARLQRKIVHTSIRERTGDRFQGALNGLKAEWLDLDKLGQTGGRMNAYQCCMADRSATMITPVAMAQCLEYEDVKPCNATALQAAGPFNKTLFYHNTADFSRYYNVFRHALVSDEIQFARGIPPLNPIRSLEPYDVIHEVYTNFFETMNVTECAKPKLDQLLANSKLEASSSTKFQTVYDDLMDLFQSCWVWSF